MMPKKKPQSEFTQRVYRAVRLIPEQKLSTYGQIAHLIGSPRSAQQVGWTLHWSDDDIPAFRVVNRFGGLAGGYTNGGRDLHRADLEEHGYKVREDDTVDLKEYLWQPSVDEEKEINS
jgi:methylated-DNA-protein-cysteine methyltransferase-like protein